MDIWRWVREAKRELARDGRTRLAELMERIPWYVVEDQHERLDAVVPEALALAREAKSPWIELFIRHWNLQSRILHRHEVRQHLPEAVRLVEFASRDEARECPQSVCVTQDLTSCYDDIDGLGYAPERLAVAKETLGRIDARWACFTCISGEYAAALMDHGDVEGALAFLDRQEADLAAVGRGPAVKALVPSRISAMFELGRHEEALALARASKADASTENERTTAAIACALALARLGRTAEALDELPAFARVLPTHSHYGRWSATVTELAQRGAIPNDAQLDGELAELWKRLSDCGVLRTSLDVAHRRARLALARRDPATARACADDLRATVPLLRAPHGADEALAKLEAAIADAEPHPS